MKNYIIVLLLLTSMLSFSQAAVNKIAKDVCRKIGDPSFLKNNQETAGAEMETFILGEIAKYKDEIHQENGFDVTDILTDEEVQKELGEQVAGEMLTECPGTLLKITKNSGLLNNDNSDEE